MVRRIFAEKLDGKGDRAIASGLNSDGIPCPSARRPEQNRHRLADGWQGSTVRSILDNPRYTGYAFFGRWTKQETLIDPDDVAAGHVVRFRRSAPDRVVRSRRPAHPEIIDVETFTQAQLRRRAKGAGGLATARKAERSERPTKRIYLFRGLIRARYARGRWKAAHERTPCTTGVRRGHWRRVRPCWQRIRPPCICGRTRFERRSTGGSASCSTPTRLITRSRHWSDRKTSRMPNPAPRASGSPTPRPSSAATRRRSARASIRRRWSRRSTRLRSNARRHKRSWTTSHHRARSPRPRCARGSTRLAMWLRRSTEDSRRRLRRCTRLRTCR
jgi:hypothetical protein